MHKYAESGCFIKRHICTNFAHRTPKTRCSMGGFHGFLYSSSFARLRPMLRNICLTLPQICFLCSSARVMGLQHRMPGQILFALNKDLFYLTGNEVKVIVGHLDISLYMYAVDVGVCG